MIWHVMLQDDGFYVTFPPFPSSSSPFFFFMSNFLAFLGGIWYGMVWYGMMCVFLGAAICLVLFCLVLPCLALPCFASFCLVFFNCKVFAAKFLCILGGGTVLIFRVFFNMLCYVLLAML